MRGSARLRGRAATVWLATTLATLAGALAAWCAGAGAATGRTRAAAGTGGTPAAAGTGGTPAAAGTGGTAAATGGAGTGARACRGARLRPSLRNERAVEAAVVCLVDGVRAAHGERRLRVSAKLDVAAASKVRSMVSEDYFANVTPAGQTPMSLVASVRYGGRGAALGVGENIAWGSRADATPARVVASWMASREHREVMLYAGYVEAGAGVLPRAPALLHARGRAATYALELAAP
ncbi:MAG TPA: CAP domain-containing protein [Solirubrobacteraceae bacterium]|nr:CAP domain-containing protein [Solirubrobacteraceae bacterium]